MKYVLLLLIAVLSLSFTFDKDEPLVNVFTETGNDGALTFYASNNSYCPESVIISFTVIKNFSYDVKFPYTVLVNENTTKMKLFTLVPKQGKTTQLSYSYKSCPGDILNMKADKDFIYRLPYAQDSAYKVDQGYGGSFSHNMKNRTYATDFAMPIGTLICAARDGVVIDVKDDSNKGGPSKSFISNGNYIHIYHSDGSLGLYFHLKKNGSLVKPGDKIKAGDPIGYSGNTGYSSGPHLHFEVAYYNSTLELTSIPVKFLTAQKDTVTLQQNKYYTSTHL